PPLDLPTGHSSRSTPLLDAPSFPTRRSSDLHADPFAADLPHGRERQVVDTLALEADFASRDPSRRLAEPDDRCARHRLAGAGLPDRKSTRLNSSHVQTSYTVFCLKHKTTDTS